MKKLFPKTSNKFILLNQRKQTWKIALRISLTYLLFSLAWILLSDTAVLLLAGNAQKMSEISTIKGLLFVFFSSILIFYLIAPSLKKLSDNEQVITENRNELKLMLYYDYLTGLSNRRKLLERLPDYLTEEKGTDKAVLYIDIDNIKLINDTMGHGYGDALIAETCRQLQSVLTAPDELFRYGGDEFVILVRFRGEKELEEKTAKVLALFASPLSVDKLMTHSTISIGIALYPHHSSDPVELMKYADLAMYQSKKRGKNRSMLYDAKMMEGINERMLIGEKLHDALSRRELEVYYQPQIDTVSRKVASFEALLRWTNAEMGRVAPDVFIPVAEETHLIIPIGEWVLRQACLFLKKMHDGGFTELTMSVNISIIQILHENFIIMVNTILSETGIDPAKLELEITETVLMESSSNVLEHLNELRKKGIGIALDDFGKGYSSLSYLEQLPITILKIDKTFVDRITPAGTDSSITGNIVGIGKKLGFIVIAEGVETETQFEYLASQKCDKIQGWLFSKALCESEAEAFTAKTGDR